MSVLDDMMEVFCEVLEAAREAVALRHVEPKSAAIGGWIGADPSDSSVGRGVRKTRLAAVLRILEAPDKIAVYRERLLRANGPWADPNKPDPWRRRGFLSVTAVEPPARIEEPGDGQPEALDVRVLYEPATRESEPDWARIRHFAEILDFEPLHHVSFLPRRAHTKQTLVRGSATFDSFQAAGCFNQALLAARFYIRFGSLVKKEQRPETFNALIEAVRDALRSSSGDDEKTAPITWEGSLGELFPDIDPEKNAFRTVRARFSAITLVQVQALQSVKLETSEDFEPLCDVDGAGERPWCCIWVPSART